MQPEVTYSKSHEHRSSNTAFELIGLSRMPQTRRYARTNEFGAVVARCTICRCCGLRYFIVRALHQIAPKQVFYLMTALHYCAHCSQQLSNYSG
jgi:hypothetical protein